MTENIPQSVINIQDVKEFNRDLQRFADRLIVLSFYTDTCPVCKSYIPHLEAIQQEFQQDDIFVARINAQIYPQIAQQFDVMGVPHTLFIKNKQIIHQFTGKMIKPQLRSLIKDLLEKYFHKTSQVGREFDMMYM